MSYSIAQHLKETSATLARASEATARAEEVARKLSSALLSGHKLLVCGNGGSAADAQHFVAELVGRFEKARPGFPAVALTTDTSILTAIANDFSYDEVFSRQVQAFAQKGDVVVGISTSGNSKSVILALEEAKRRGAWTAALTGQTGGKMKPIVDCCVCVPATRTAHIQECHIALIHAICACFDEDVAPALA
ncbi:MAG TPA: D-sedoheptulose 7-phosphate isomerase [Elusimicrobiota bacterium]|nr:D-sedoheptulose 7-phosphate isomerase [Elusimicrobiota bacterium]